MFFVGGSVAKVSVGGALASSPKVYAVCLSLFCSALRRQLASRASEPERVA